MFLHLYFLINDLIFKFTIQHAKYKTHMSEWN